MNAPAHTPDTDRAWLAEVIERARDQMVPSGIFAPGHEYARAIVALADEVMRQNFALFGYEAEAHGQSTHQVVYAVLCHEGVGTDIDSVWRTEQEAQAEVDKLRRLFPGYGYSVQPNALQGAR